MILCDDTEEDAAEERKDETDELVAVEAVDDVVVVDVLLEAEGVLAVLDEVVPEVEEVTDETAEETDELEELDTAVPQENTAAATLVGSHVVTPRL